MTRPDLAARLHAVERRLLRTQALFAVTITLGAVGLAASGAAASDEQVRGVIRARGIDIVDAAGVPRVRLGAPVPDGTGEGGSRRAPATGLTIHGPDGRERLGLGTFDDGLTVLGFDAAPGRGTGTNRERLHLGVDAAGRGFVRFLDQQSRLAGRLVLTDRDRVALGFWGPSTGGRMARSEVDLDGYRKLPDHVMR